MRLTIPAALAVSFTAKISILAALVGGSIGGWGTWQGAILGATLGTGMLLLYYPFRRLYEWMAGSLWPRVCRHHETWFKAYGF